MADTTESGGGGLGSLMRIGAWGGAAVLFLLPVAAERFWEEMGWSAGDFVVWGAMLLAACGAFELAMRMSGSLAYRAGAAVAVGAAFLLVWISLAVGIIGSEDDPANLMYGGVLAVGIAGAVVARFRPAGMARALAAMGAAQALAAVIALAAGWGAGTENWPQVIVVLNGVFVALWFGSAWLFRKAARERAAAAAAAA
ncbi:MAG TPA: hypothetical protein VF559_03310 [Caulobacteraceae bacterium]|jgi:hypothetical protein